MNPYFAEALAAQRMAELRQSADHARLAAGPTLTRRLYGPPRRRRRLAGLLRRNTAVMPGAVATEDAVHPLTQPSTATKAAADSGVTVDVTFG